MPKFIQAHKGGILTSIAGLCVALSLAMVGYVSATRSHSASSTGLASVAIAHARLVPPTSTEVIGSLGRVGLVPDALAAAGLSAQNATSVVTAARSHLATHIDELRNADSACASAAASVNSLRDLVQSGRATSQQRSDFSTAKATLASANSTRQSILNGLFAAATEGLDQAATSTISLIHSNRDRLVDTKYLAASRTDAQWLALREALDHTRIAALRGTEPDPAAVDLVSDANSAAASAAAALQANLPTINNAWIAALPS